MTGPTGKVMLMPEEKADTDYIMVATGTGIAPYRGFIRRLFTETTPAGEAYKGLAWLFLGVANSDALLYDEEWQAAKSKFPDNFRVDYALSREEKNKKGGKMYIQDKVRFRASLRFDLWRGRVDGAALDATGHHVGLPHDEFAHRSRSTLTRSSSASRTAPSCTSAASRA